MAFKSFLLFTKLPGCFKDMHTQMPAIKYLHTYFLSRAAVWVSVCPAEMIFYL